MALVEGHMRALLAGFVLILSSSFAFAQQPAASTAGSRTYVSAADVNGLIAKAKAEADYMITAEGVCRGRTDDGINRDAAGYEFHIKIENCRAIRVETFAEYNAKKTK